jgi:hypothetical protein
MALIKLAVVKHIIILYLTISQKSLSQCSYHATTLPTPRWQLFFKQALLSKAVGLHKEQKQGSYAKMQT